MTQCKHDFHLNVNPRRTQSNAIPHHAMSNCIITHNVNPNVNPRMNVTTVKCSGANEIITTHHMRHIVMPIDQIIKNLLMLCNILLNVTLQSHPTNHGCCKQKRTCLTVTTINPIHCRPHVPFGTFFKVLIDYFVGK